MVYFTQENIFWQTNRYDSAFGTILLPNKFAVNFKQIELESPQTPVAKAVFSAQILSPIIANDPPGFMEPLTGTLMPTDIEGFHLDGTGISLEELAKLLNDLQRLKPTEAAREIQIDQILKANTADQNEWLDITQYGEKIINPDTGQIVPLEGLSFKAIPQP